ncbi:DUF397 domain-containing protein [Streptomyces gamaensis]|uniref:DUF397 domain-containing protein n=1 Tax=Streptomyces gamaensis TaxID=1763542 RepID=A0ABW0ZEM4_9ACTN
MLTTEPDLSRASWRKSTYSQSSGGCVEITEEYPDRIPVRDSKAHDRIPVVVPRRAWTTFVTAVAATDGRLPA